VVGQISTANDNADFYRFVVGAGGEYRVALQAGMEYIYLRIYDTSGSEIWSRTAYWNGTAGRIDFVENVVLSSGTYYFAAAKYGSRSGFYSLSISPSTPATDTPSTDTPTTTTPPDGGQSGGAPQQPPAPPTVTVQFDVAGGQGSTTISVTAGSPIGTLPGATRPGYTFRGWYTAVGGGTRISAQTPISAATTFYAHWTAKKYTVKFAVNGGKKLASSKAKKKVVFDAKYGKLPTPKYKKAGYKFRGWYTAKVGGTKVKASSRVKITKTTTLYAQWKKR
jgi:uncharacterized repeat protein (TIGR02543 family)